MRIINKGGWEGWWGKLPRGLRLFRCNCSETEHLAVHISQADDALLIGLSDDHTKFKKAATRIRHQIDGKRHLSRVESTRAMIIAEKTIRKMSTLRKDLSLIFQGPTASALDNAHSIISWAAALPITDWKSDGMSNEVFNYLIGRIEAAEEVQPWPPVVREVLRIFQLEVMPHSEEYNKFLDDFEYRTPKVPRIEVSSLLRTD
ncbi:hypothetical protein CC78DRAFT_585115 [Lojkania enalia]|uniref:Uncharacterized protein n=1 Tax=Lojkania enalia TaxID=147567 RepID=A0A9P4K3J7_9PLEO|nr:hypothetical protein CC78DRAFT_585115 [Didymosphaeria enalia]